MRQRQEVQLAAIALAGLNAARDLYPVFLQLKCQI
jgi:hypothetical protein